VDFVLGIGFAIVAVGRLGNVAAPTPAALAVPDGL